MLDPQYKEMQDDIKRNTEETRLFQTEILERMERLKVGNASKFDEIHTALDILIQQTPSKQRHGTELNSRPPFQVRNIKLEFPRFDGTNVHEWIFRAEQFLGTIIHLIMIG